MSKTKIAIGVALLALLTLMPFDLGWRYWQLRSEGIEADAIVTNVTARSSRRRLWWYYEAVYQFTDAAGRRRTGSQEISEDLYQVLKASKPDRHVTIVYCPSRPYLNVLNLHMLGSKLFWWGGSLAVIWMLLALALLQSHRENSGIVAGVRRRMLLDQARRASAPPGLQPGPRQRPSE
jgi:hypothetical protein